MATNTDISLRSALDANQRDREQMCRSVLALDRRYSDVKPRHPLGGPDGGRDIEALLDGDRLAFAAVGFVNSASDSSDDKKQIKAKFDSDLNSALNAKPDLKAFIFFTNVRLTVGEQAVLQNRAKERGVEHCDIIDRERLRIELDAPAGFFIRFQYLGIPLSQAEQASFLSKYGDQVQEMVTSGFRRMESKLDRLMFLQESAEVLDVLTMIFRLKETYPAEQIGHFRAFISLSLQAIPHGILRVLFGASDKPSRFSEDRDSAARDNLPGIGNGIGYGQWEHHLKLNDKDNAEDGPTVDRFVPVGGGSSIGSDPVSAISIRYTHDIPLIRYLPRMQLRDLDGSMFIPLVNRSLAAKMKSIEVYANAYKLLQIDEFEIDGSKFTNDIPVEFSDEELKDGWVRIRPVTHSTFHLRFNQQTPRRLYAAGETPHTPAS